MRLINAIMSAIGIVCLLSLSAALSAERNMAAKAAGQRAYVQSGPDGVFYARSVPVNAKTKTAHTDVYRVEGETDKLVDRYEWFAPEGMVLGWSPIKGEVCVMAAFAEEREDWRTQEELRFCAGGRLLKAYTAAELLALGADETLNLEYGGKGAACRMIGCEQIPGTNEYDFVVDVGKGKRLRFDITTGELRQVTKRDGDRAK